MVPGREDTEPEGQPEVLTSSFLLLHENHIVRSLKIRVQEKQGVR